MTTPQENLEVAIKVLVDHLRQTSENHDQGVITSWAVVVHTHSFDDDGAAQSAYYQLYSGGSVPDHVAIGLYRMGEHLVLHGERVD